MFRKLIIICSLFCSMFLSCNEDNSTIRKHKLTGSWKLNQVYLINYDNDIPETWPAWCSSKVFIDEEGNAEFFNYNEKKVLTSTSIIPVTFFEDFYFNSKEPGTFFWFFDKNHKEDGIGYIENGKIFISDIDEKIFCEYIKESDTKELKDD